MSLHVPILNHKGALVVLKLPQGIEADVTSECHRYRYIHGYGYGYGYEISNL